MPAMKSFFRAVLTLAFVLGSVVATPVHAVGLFQDCSQPGDDLGYSYTCLDESTCLSAGGGPAGGCGLGAPADAVCCKKAAGSSGEPAPVRCEDQGGVCRVQCDAGLEQSIGQFSCLTGYSCCKSTDLVSDPFRPFDCPDNETCPQPTTPAGTSGEASSEAGSGASTQGSGGQTVPQLRSPDRLVLPGCTKTGDCTLNDIVQTGVNFATFVMGLSGALFFAVFIYGGALYLLSFGNKSRVQKGKDAIKGAVIGMVFVLGAWTIVNTLVKGLKGQSTAATPPAQSKCQAQGAGYSCVTLQGSTSQAAVADGNAKGYTCKTGLCPGAVNVLCCKLK
jgi:hypothetical protein